MRAIATALAAGLCRSAVGDMRAAGMSQAVWDPTSVRVEPLQLPRPSPGAGEVLIRVQASSVNHLDVLWQVIQPAAVWSAFQAAWQVQGGFPKVLGLDVAGTVAAVGAGVTRARVGDEVWAFNAKDCVYDGKTLGGISGHTWAEYVAVPQDMVGLKPRNLNFTEAGSLPLVALTSLQALKLAGAPWTGDTTVLILGGSGGTGHVAVQLAKVLGAARVLTTASGSNRDYLLSLGADEVIDYHTQHWADEAVVPGGSLDAVVDMVMKPGSGDVAYKKLRQHGHYVGLCKGIPECGVPTPSLLSQLGNPTLKHHELRCTAGFPGYCVSGEQIDELRGYVEAGKLHPTVAQAFPLAQAQEAVESLLGGHVRGKVAVTVGEAQVAIAV